MKTLDVVITSTCRRTIVETLKSFQKNVHFSGKYRFLVNVDVIKPSYLTKLEEFLRNVKINSYLVNMNPKPWPSGLTEAINNLYERIESELYFNLQDDWIFLKKVNLDQIVDVMMNNQEIDHIRFSKQKIRPYCWLYHLSEQDTLRYRKKKENIKIGEIELVKTFTWSFNPSVSRTGVARRFIPVPVVERAETYFCRMYDEIYDTRGTYIYGEIGDGPAIRDIGRNRLRQLFRNIRKKILTKEN